MDLPEVPLTAVLDNSIKGLPGDVAKGRSETFKKNLRKAGISTPIAIWSLINVTLWHSCFFSQFGHRGEGKH